MANGITARDFLSSRRNAAQKYAQDRGVDYWTNREYDLQQSVNDLNNYMSSGNWTTDNTANFRSSATKAVEDLTNEMNRYGSSTNEYKQLKNYKTYYENALGQFDKMDVVSNTQDYIGNWGDNGFDNWHTEDEYNTQRTYLDDQRNQIQSQIDEIEKKMKEKGEYYNADLETLKSYMKMYDELSGYLDERNAWDRRYPTAEDFTSYQKSFDYNYSSDLEDTVAAKTAELEEKYKELSFLESKFGAPSQNLGVLLGNAAKMAGGVDTQMAMIQDPEGYQSMLDLKEEVNNLRSQVEAAQADLDRVHQYQVSNIYQNYGDYDPNVDWQEKVDRLKNSLRIAEDNGKREEAAKIKQQIEFLAGPNGDGTDANGLYDDESYLGQWHLQNIDLEKDKAEYDQLEAELAARGAGTTNAGSMWHKLGAAAIDAQNAQMGITSARPASADAYNIENDPEVIKMRDRKQDLWRNMQSAEKYQNRAAMTDSYNELGEDQQKALTEAGKAAVAEDGKTYLDARGNNVRLKNFEFLSEERDADLRDLVYAAIGAELAGEDIGFTVDDILQSYEKRMARTAGAAKAKADNEIENDFARWNKQVLGVGTISGLNQFATGVKQAFTEDLVEPNRAAYRGQYTREYLKQYGDEVLFGNSAVGGSNVSQLLFDTTQTTANMLPMIAASYVATKLGAPEVVAELLGAGLMSVSSAGNSYQQALSEGWEKDDAKTFAVITGAAEGGLQYLMGGISKLGGKGAEPLLQLAERINDAGARVATKTALHIASETAEELIQNRIERYLRYKFNGEDSDYMSWTEDDWYTVLVTALSTGLMEGPGEVINTARQTKLGDQLAGNTIPSKGWTEKQKQWNAALRKVGKAMEGVPALKESLVSFATNPELIQEGGVANSIATRMKDGKIEANATNLGRLYSAILEEYSEKNAPGIQAAMVGVIGGGVQYNKNQQYQSELDAANKQVAEIKAANPNATVLDLNESELMKFPGVTLEAAKAYSPILNKIMSGTELTAAEMAKMMDGSTAGEAALNLLRQMAEYKEAELLLRLDKASVEEGINQMVQQFQRRKAERKAAAEAAVSQAQVDAVNDVRVAEAAEGANQQATIFRTLQEQVAPEVVTDLRKAEADAQAALEKINKIKSMTIKELGTTKLFEDLAEENAGAVDAKVGGGIYDDLQKQLQDLQKRADKLSAIKFPSRQQTIELTDIRQQQAAIQQRIDTMMDELTERVIAKTRGESTAKAPAQTGTVQTVAPAPADVVSINGANVTREEFLASRRAAIESGERTVEDVNAEFDAMLAGTGGTVKENVNGRNQSSNPAQERNDVGNAADRGEDRSGPDQSGREAVSRNGAGGIELFAGNKNAGNGRVYASEGAAVTDSEHEASLHTAHPEINGLGQYLLDSGFTSVRYVTNGQLLVESVNPETGERVSMPVAAIVRGTEVVLNPDFKFKDGNTLRKTAEHERMHLRLRLLRKSLGPDGLAQTRGFVSSTLQNLLGEQEYRAAFMKYLAEYGPTYAQNETLSMTDLGHMINEEMFCDMVAGLNCWDTGLGKYEKDIAGMLDESNFDALTDAIVNDEDLDVGLTYEETEAMPYGYEMKEKIDITDPFRNDVDRSKPPESRPLPGEEAMHEEQQLMSKQSMAEATGFELIDNDEGFPYALKNQRTGEIVNKVTPHMMVDTPIGKLVTTAKDNGFISNYAANREYVMLSQVMNLILENKDAALTWELVGSQLFSGLKKNSDTQYNWTVDFGTICRKTQALITAMSETMKKVGHGLSRREIEEVYLQTGLAGEATPCPVCYVFSRWMGIGGLLDDINTFQNTYFTIDQNTGAFTWADGKSEADLAAFMSGIERDVVAWAEEKQKEDFFQDENAENKFAQSNLNFGKILSDIKSSPNRILAEAVKKINDSRQAVLLIQELESSAKKATGEKARKLNNAIAKMREYILTDDQIKAQEAKITQAEAALAEFDRYQWAARAVMRREATDRFENGERVYEWKFRNDYKPVPQDVLFDLDKGEEFAKNYASTWAFRTGKGNAMGKAIMPYSDARVGETIQGVATKNTKVLNQEMINKMDVDPEDKKAVKKAMDAVKAGIKSGAALNPFVQETSLQKSYAEAKQSGDKKAIRAAEKALKANWKEQGDFVDRAMNAIRKQNLIGGMRMQSTSDFRFEWGSDYLITFFELQAIGANVQLYTKVIEAVDFLASTGADCNLSVMPRGLGYSSDGKLEFSDVTGINAEEAIKKAKQYDNAQLILVGISDENIKLALAGTDVTFVIPFHGSGQSVDQVQTLVNLLGEDLDVELAQDYSDVQDDHIDPRLSKEEAAKTKAMRALRMDIIQGKFWQKGTKKKPGFNKPLSPEQQALMAENPHLARLYDMFYNERPNLEQFTQCMVDDNGRSIAYHCFLGKEQAAKIFPYEYWDTSLRYADADQNGENFKAYCKSLGIIPRFSGINAKGEEVDHGNFIDVTGYWKLLIDRKMYKNDYDAKGNWIGYGEFRNQQKINVSDVKVGMLNETSVRKNISKDAWTKDIHPDKTAEIVEKSAARIEEMREQGDIYDTKKISKEFRADRLAARKDLREAEQQQMSLQEEDNTPIAQTYTSKDTSINSSKLPVVFTKVGQYGKYTIPSKASLTERRAQEYNENTQQRFSKQESENNGGENAAAAEPRVHRLNQFLQKNDWARSYIQAAREGSPGVRARDLWRTTERRQREITNGVADFFADYPTIGGKKLTEVFDYGTPDFIDWFFQEAARDPEWLWGELENKLEGSPEELVDIFDKALKDTKAPKKFRPSFTPTDLDQEYLKAIKKNDTVTLARMVKERAEKNGFKKEVFQHAKVEFPSFSRGELGFHLGSESQAAQFVQGSQHNLNPDLFLHLYANIENPEYLPMHTKERWDPDIGDWEQYDSNDYDNWNIKELAEQLEDLSPEIKAIADSTDTKYDTNKWGSKARKEFTDALDALGIHALEYDNDVEGKRGEQVKSSPYVVYDPERDNLTAYIIWDPTRLKSGDLITYETDPTTGEEYIVPLSERFDPENEQFRYSKQEEAAPETPVTNPFQPNTFEYDLMNAILKKGDKGAAEWATKVLQQNNQKLESTKIIPPRVPTKSFVPMPTKEEMAAIEKERLDRIGKWGALPPSEKADSDWVLPRKDEEGRAQSRFPQNAATANVLDEPAKDVTKRFAFTDHAATHVIDSNEADLKHAKDTIQRKGYERSVASFLDMAEEMTWHYAGDQSLTKVLALGQQLLVESSKQGTYRDYLDVLSSLTLLATQAGKSLQAFRMLKETGPIGELYYVQKTVDQMNNKKYAKLIESGKQKPITVDPKLSKAVVLAATEEERNKAMDKLIASIAEQIPVNFMEKWNAWRHFAMLGNARTHIRNLAGNGIFVPLRFAKDLMAYAGESIAVATGKMQESERTKAIVVSAELREFAKKDALVMQKELQGNGKYNPAQEILDARQIFKVKALDKASKWNGQMLEKEDWWFLAPAYQKALAAALSHTGFTIKELQTTKEGQKALSNARRIAIEEAQRATYRDFSVAAAALNRLKRGGGAAGILLEGVLPFTKTPINILRRGIEYSPVGMITALTGLAKDYKAGAIDAAKFIDRMSAGMTGTMVAILGYLLAKMGWLRGKKDDKEEDFDKLQGYQDYSLQIGDVSMTIDWAAPTALPLFTGAAAHDLMEGDEKLSLSTVWDTMLLIAEPMMSLSMLDGLNRTLSAASYAGENEKIASIVTSAMTSYFGQGVPTLLGQLARSMDGTRRQTYVDKNSPVPAGMQRFIQSSIQNKIPIWEEQKSAYIDQWGREDTTSSKALGTLENFLSPSYWSMVKTTDVDAALQELYSATKDSSVLPSSPTKEVNGHKLTAAEYESYARDVGTTKYNMMSMLVHDPRYQNLSDEEKIRAVEKIYTYSNCAGKYHFDPTYNIRKNGGVWVQEAEAMLTDQQRYNRIWQAIEESLKD